MNLAAPSVQLPSGDTLTGIDRILVFRALLLGDMLCAVPGWRALRKAYPEASITLVSLPWAQCLLSRFPQYFDDFLSFPGHPAFPEQEARLEEWPAFLQRVRETRFDLVIQQQGNGRVANAFCLLFGGRCTTGFRQEETPGPAEGDFIPWPSRMPEIWRHLHLMRRLGAREEEDSLEFPVTARERESALQMVAERGGHAGRPLACLHPGAKAPERRWPVEEFGQVGRWLAEEGFQVLVTGTRAEADLTAAVCRAMGGQGIDLAGAFPDIGLLGALLAQSRLLVCGDTGVSHLACAVRCPSTVVFTRPETEGWPPLDRVRHPVVAGIGGVGAGTVLRTVRDLLDRTRV